jgi:hypothetical protein
LLSISDYDITGAIRLFGRFSVEACYLVPTQTGLEKSIMDATGPVRSYLKQAGLHDYDGQRQGPEGKRIIPAVVLTENGSIETTASLYRPNAKGGEGDPRIWISKLKQFAGPNNLLALLVHKGTLYVANVSNSRVRDSASDSNAPLGALLRRMASLGRSVADELLDQLRAVAALGWIPTVTAGATGIGATIEHRLGIAINSSRSPDYKGIEIKAKRSGKIRTPTRSTLFAQVPDWSLSRLKSSEQILDTFGYYRGPVKKLYCTLSAKGRNSQGLFLKVDEPRDCLEELHSDGLSVSEVAKWQFRVLRDRLVTKHNETFWIAADSRTLGSVEHFRYHTVVHTRRPFAGNFHTLCHEGVVTVDHLIKRNLSGRVSEKGPLFKILPDKLDLLFPPAVVYDLTLSEIIPPL